MTRHCSRPGCSEVAVAALSYHYASATAWIEDLGSERDPHAYDLCEQHLVRLRVPSGWELDDRRPRPVGRGGVRLAG